MNFQRYPVRNILIPMLCILTYSDNLMGYNKTLPAINIVNNSDFTIRAQVTYWGQQDTPTTGVCWLNCPETVYVDATKTLEFIPKVSVTHIEIFSQASGKSFGQVDLNLSREYNVAFDGTKPSLEKK